MKEPYIKKEKPLYYGPESCAGSREVTREVVDRGNVGQPLSSEITSLGCRPRSLVGKAIQYMVQNG